MSFNVTASDFVTDRALLFLSRVQAATSVQDVIDCVNDVIHCFGISHFTFYEFSAPGGLIEGSFPKEWTDRYQENAYHIADPVFRRLRRAPTAFSWQELAPAFTDEPKSRRVLDEATDFQLKEGYTIPVSDLSGLRGVMSFAGERADDHPKVFAALQLISVFAHAKYQDLTKATRPARAELSDREIDCLSWAAMGKPDKVIAAKLGVSVASVRVYLDRARTKLNAANKTHAIAIGIRERIIMP